MSTASGGDDAASTTQKKPRFNLAPIQKFGRSLLLPIASLPAAALLMRLGAEDMLGADGLGWTAVAPIIGAAGNALFDNLPILFAVGVAIGMAKKADGSTALAAVIGFVVWEAVCGAMSPVVLGPPPEGEEQIVVDFHVLGGIIIGLTAAFLWQRYYRIKLPPYLAFFGGRRFVPMVVALAAIVLAVLMSFVYPFFAAGITAMGEWVTENAVLGGFVFGFANRLLIPLGLHHVLNNPPWFIMGSFETADGVVHGDIERFLSGDPTAGIFLTGFFPIMMFALPAAAMAIWHEAKPAKRKLTGGVMISVALTSFLTGVTEPLEFAFMFVAWPLYVIHAFFTGTSMALVNFLEIKLGFGFSAGLFDMIMNWRIGTEPALLIPIGLGYAVLYYVVFRFVIRIWNLKTPGREDDAEETADAPEARG